MSNLRYIIAAGLLSSGFAAPRLLAAKVTPDIAPAQKRDATVDLAEKLTKRQAPAAIPAEQTNPFSPSGFEQPDPSAVPNAGAPRAGPTNTPSAAVAQAVPQKPAGDREILETLATRLTPSGMIAMGGKPLLIIDRNRFGVGTKFIVTYNEQDFELELAAIDRTNFTLRYRGEEMTRPIKPASK